MTDHIETIGSSIIQHGSANNRVYLMKLTRQDCPDIISQLDRLALNQGYTKIFAKVPSTALEQFLDSGYELEASIPGFYHPDDVCFLGKYYCQTRKREGEPEQISLVLAAARQQKQVAEQHLSEGFVCRIAEEHDTVAMTKVYRAVFASYPFPIFDPAYLKEIMGATLFFGIWEGDELVALSSAEMDGASGSVEMTDFATLTGYRGHGLALFLLQRMEQEMDARGIHNFYTIARSYSHGMNITFARNGYTYSGTLTNNTNIFGKLESMNVWHKQWELVTC
jgi:putative beta-lysine N-acetyltransferase